MVKRAKRTYAKPTYSAFSEVLRAQDARYGQFHAFLTSSRRYFPSPELRFLRFKALYMGLWRPPSQDLHKSDGWHNRPLPTSIENQDRFFNDFT